MPIDVFGLILVVLSALALILCLITSVVVFRRIPYRSHQFFTLASAFGALWVISYLPGTIFLQPEFQEFIHLVQNVGFISATGFALGLNFWVTSAYRSRFHGPLRTLAVFFAGAFCFSALFPDSYALVLVEAGWNIGWTVTYSPFLLMAYVGFILVLSYIMLAYCWEIVLAIRRAESQLYHTTAPILLICIMLLLFSSGMIAVVRINSFLPRLLFLIPLAVAIWIITLLIYKNPTVHIITAPQIHFLFVLDLRSGMPLYTYSFSTKGKENDLELLSSLLGAAKTVLGEITSTMRRISSITTPFGECLIEEIGPIGTFLLTDGEVSATRDSLRYCTRAFLREYQTSIFEENKDMKVYQGFETTVEKYFDFAF